MFNKEKEKPPIEHRNNLRNRILLFIYLSIFTFVTVGGMLLIAFLSKDLSKLVRVFLLITYGVPSWIVGGLLYARWKTKHFAYRCAKCGHEFDISPWTCMIAVGGLDQYLRCPKCHKRSWATMIDKTEK